ncbi:hypothetical protein [Cetobacterium sp.]|uniref:hypothetical protein n=1 Tax=Cetobacterium sp. TaxID=2071632 RepID=UPI003F3DCE0D
MYSENLFIKVEEYNKKFNDSFPIILLPDVKESIIIQKIDECLKKNKPIYEVVDWFDIYGNLEILA